MRMGCGWLFCGGYSHWMDPVCPNRASCGSMTQNFKIPIHLLILIRQNVSLLQHERPDENVSESSGRFGAHEAQTKKCSTNISAQPGVSNGVPSAMLPPRTGEPYEVASLAFSTSQRKASASVA